MAGSYRLWRGGAPCWWPARRLLGSQQPPAAPAWCTAERRCRPSCQARPQRGRPQQQACGGNPTAHTCSPGAPAPTPRPSAARPPWLRGEADAHAPRNTRRRSNARARVRKLYESNNRTEVLLLTRQASRDMHDIAHAVAVVGTNPMRASLKRQRWWAEWPLPRPPAGSARAAGTRRAPAAAPCAALRGRTAGG